MADWLKLESVNFAFPGRQIFSDLSMSVEKKNRVLAVVGPSGVGKSTLISLLAGHLSAESGEISVCEERIEGPSASRPVVFQEHNLFPWLNVLDNVVFGLKCAGVPKFERYPRGRQLLKMMRLEDSEEYFPGQLSGGMSQRVGLARALAVDPVCILMDEPFNALDHEIKEAVRGDFLASIMSSDAHAVIVTHDLGEALLLGSEVLVLLGHAEVARMDLSDMELPRPGGFQQSARYQDLINNIRGLMTRSMSSETDADVSETNR